MNWDIEDIKNYIIAHEEYGGSLAVIDKNSTQILSIYSASGRLISQIKWLDAPVIGMGWSEDECLFLLQKSGRVAIKNLHCEHIGYRKMGDDVIAHEVKSFRFFATHEGTGLAVLTESNELFYRSNIMNIDSHIIRIPNTEQFFQLDSDWISLTNQNGSVIVLTGYKNQIIEFESTDFKTIKSSSSHKIHGQGFEWYSNLSSETRIIKFALSPSHQNLAFITNDGQVWLVKSTDLSHILSYAQFSQLSFGNNNEHKEQLQMEWAGEELCVIYYQDALFLTDIRRQFTERFFLDQPLLFPEIDGVRVITKEKHEFIQLIQRDLEQLYQIGSDSPAIWLFDAQQHLESNSYDTVRFIDHIRTNTDQLKKAIDVCLSAASYCLEPRWQKTILNSVRLGRSFLPDYKSDRVTDIHSKLLLLNNLKLPFAAMPLTLSQLEQLTIPVLIDRLINRGYYPIIEKLCNRLRIPRQIGLDRMLMRWAEMAVDSIDDVNDNNSQQRIFELISARLCTHKGFDYARIAQRAVVKKKMYLAEKLLEREVRIEHQVKILLKMENYKMALPRAIDSGNSELISYVVSQLYNKDKLDQLLFDKYPIIRSVLLDIVVTPKQTQELPEFISRDIDNLPTSRADSLLKILLKKSNPQEVVNKIPAVQDQYKKCNLDFMVQILDDHKTILTHMQSTTSSNRGGGGGGVNTDSLMTTPSTPPPGLSLYDYLSWLYDNHLDDKAESLAHKLRVSDRITCYLKLKSCAKSGGWGEFEQILTSSRWSRKLPISYNDVAELCVNYENEQLYRRYSDKVEPEKRVRLLVKLEKFSEAEDLARSLRNEFLISYVTAIKFNITSG